MKREKKQSNKLNCILQGLIVGCFTFIVLYVLVGSMLSPDLGLFQESAQAYNHEWILEQADGTEKVFTMPTGLDMMEGESATIRTVLPDQVEDGTYLAITTGKCYKVYIDGVEIYSFDNTGYGMPGDITKPVIVPIPLRKSHSGKQLSLELTNGKYGRSMVNTAYIGSLMGIAIRLIKESALQFTLASLLVIASLITIGIFKYIEKRDGRKAPLIHLAQGILSISLWIIFNSHLFQLVFGAYFFDGVVGFMLVIIMGVPFLQYFDAILGERYHKSFAACECLSVVNFIVLTVLHMTGILSYYTVLVYIDGMLVVYIVVMLVCVGLDYATRKESEHKKVLIGLIGLGLAGCLEVVVTILNAKSPFKMDISGLCVITGMVILLFFAIQDQLKVFNLLRQETENAMAATKAKSDFLANMSHEIRTPINAIMGMNEMVLQETNQENIREYAKDINSASENLLLIVNDILDFSKIESGKLEIINDTYDLGELIYDVTTLVNMKAENKGLKLTTIVDENLPSKLYGDDKRVREIITNILNNAVKYTERGFVHMNVKGTIEGNTLVLTIRVKDSGQGIKEEDLDKIFSGFSRVNRMKNKNVEGTGLGLSITKSLVELMNGSISVESEYGKGSLFTVVLPQQIVSDEKIGNYMTHRHVSTQTAEGEKKQIEIPGVKVLVVDDTPLNLKVINKFLSKIKADVVCAESGEEMLALVKEQAFDIIFLDHMMPNMDGIETLKASKELAGNLCAHTPVIALTANAIVGAKEMYLEAGFDDYLSKPVKMEALCEMLVKYLPGEKVQ